MELEALGPSVSSMILDEDGNMIDSRPPSGEPLQFVFEEITQKASGWRRVTFPATPGARPLLSFPTPSLSIF